MANAGADRGGRPPREFTRVQIDRAKLLIGKRGYPSAVARLLRRKWPALSVRQSYRLIRAAQREVYESLRGERKADDPLTAVCLFLSGVMFSAKEKTRDKVQASATLIKLLGLNKLIDALGDGDADALLGDILKRQREAAAKPRETA